jgi:hypothetical protein
MKMIDEFICKLCNFVKEYKEFTSPDKCPECGRRVYELRFLKAPRKKVKFVNIGYKDTPRYSMTLGVSETQIEDAKKLHPQAEWKRFGHSFRPLIKNRPEKLKMMAQAGMQEYDPKGFKGKDR